MVEGFFSDVPRRKAAMENWENMCPLIVDVKT